MKGKSEPAVSGKGEKEGKKSLDMKALGPDEKVFQRSAWMKSNLIQKVCKYPA